MTRQIDLNEIADKYRRATEKKTAAPLPAVLDREGKLGLEGSVPPEEASVIPTTPFANNRAR